MLEVQEHSDDDMGPIGLLVTLLFAGGLLAFCVYALHVVMEATHA